MRLLLTEPCPSQLKKLIYNHLYDEDEESISYMLNEKLDIDSDDEMNLEIEGETASEESNDEMSESEIGSETCVVAC
jgi:diacylglycerol kinase family enzyme